VCDNRTPRRFAIFAACPNPDAQAASTSQLSISVLREIMKKHILVVDDDSLMRCSVAFNLEQAGYRASSAANAEDALAMSQRDKPDRYMVQTVILSSMSSCWIAWIKKPCVCNTCQKICRTCTSRS
jgi:hypothetical protein